MPAVPASADFIDLTDRLAAVVGGDRSAAMAVASLDSDAVRVAAEHHGVLPLVAEALGALAGVPEPLLLTLRQEAAREAAADLLREVALRELLRAFDSAGVDVLVFKGAQLAYSIYRRPDLRPRVDTDVLIASSARAAAHAVLLRLGYGPPRQVDGELVTYQAQYVKRRNDAPVHAVDLHWRIANPQVFGGLLSFEELRPASVSLPRLGPSARGLSGPHALLLACVHRVAHHFDSDCLIWLFDIHLLASGTTDDEWRQFLDLARVRRVVAVCRRSLDRAGHHFGTVVPAHVLDGLQLLAAESSREATAAYLAHNRRPFSNFLSDATALPAWSDRLRLARQHLFPSRHYMRDVYAPRSPVPLAVLYAQRVIRGVRKWVGRP